MFIQRICGSLWQNVDHFGSGSIHGGRDHQSRKLKESCLHWVGNPIIVEDVDHILNIKSMRCESISMRHSFAKKRPASILLQKFDAICRLIKDKDKHFRDQIFGQFCQFRTEVVVLGQKLKLLWYIGNILVLPYRAPFSCWFLCCIWHRCLEQTSPKTNPKSALNGAFGPQIHLGRLVNGHLFPFAWRVFYMMDSS